MGGGKKRKRERERKKGKKRGGGGFRFGECRLVLNYERVVAKPSGEPDAQAVRFTIRQLW